MYQVKLPKDLQLNKNWSHKGNFKKALFLEVIKKPIIYKFLTDFTKRKKKTFNTIDFNHKIPPQD